MYSDSETESRDERVPAVGGVVSTSTSYGDVETVLTVFFGSGRDGGVIAVTILGGLRYLLGIFVPIILIVVVLYHFAQQHELVRDETLDRFVKRPPQINGGNEIGDNSGALTRQNGGIEEVDGDEGDPAIGGVAEEESGVQPEDDDPIDPILISAEECRERGDTDLAVKRAYAAARVSLVEYVDESTRTPSAFYDICRTNEFAEEEIEALRQFTDRYERTTFAATATSADDAKLAIDEPKLIIERDV